MGASRYTSAMTLRQTCRVKIAGTGKEIQKHNMSKHMDQRVEMREVLSSI